jgi:hypothetical protein
MWRELKDIIKFNDINVCYFVFRQYNSCIHVTYVKSSPHVSVFRLSTGVVHSLFVHLLFSLHWKSFAYG